MCSARGILFLLVGRWHHPALAGKLVRERRLQAGRVSLSCSEVGFHDKLVPQGGGCKATMVEVRSASLIATSSTQNDGGPRT